MKVGFPSELRKRLLRNLVKAGRREIGGVLMAEQLEPGNFMIADFSVDNITGGEAHFVRSVEHHETALQEFYRKTGADYGRFNYLGEWHSHPNHSPVPSLIDITSMEKLIYGERSIPFAVLLIVKKTWWRRIACSATLFQQDYAPEPVKISIE